MRKNYVLLLVLLLSILTSCSNTANVDIDSEDNNLSYEEILDRLNTMTEERDALQKELDVLKAEMEEKSEEETIQESDVTVLVTDKSVTPEDIDKTLRISFSDDFNFTAYLYNLNSIVWVVLALVIAGVVILIVYMIIKKKSINVNKL